AAAHEADNLTLPRRERSARWQILARIHSGPRCGTVDQLVKKVQSVLHSDVESDGTARLQRQGEAELAECQLGPTQVALLSIAVRWPKALAAPLEHCLDRTK